MKLSREKNTVKKITDVFLRQFVHTVVSCAETEILLHYAEAMHIQPSAGEALRRVASLWPAKVLPIHRDTESGHFEAIETPCNVVSGPKSPPITSMANTICFNAYPNFL